mmetsp:Transcript_16902/g.50543  ORF Transcript_16902/g.50543 Transcript_16902/m.50543 type:complete len:713 (-) Transcript_16902:116-2254(-)
MMRLFCANFEGQLFVKVPHAGSSKRKKKKQKQEKQDKNKNKNNSTKSTSSSSKHGWKPLWARIKKSSLELYADRAYEQLIHTIQLSEQCMISLGDEVGSVSSSECFQLRLSSSSSASFTSARDHSNVGITSGEHFSFSAGSSVRAMQWVYALHRRNCSLVGSYVTRGRSVSVTSVPNFACGLTTVQGKEGTVVAASERRTIPAGAHHPERSGTSTKFASRKGKLERLPSPPPLSSASSQSVSSQEPHSKSAAAGSGPRIGFRRSEITVVQPLCKLLHARALGRVDLFGEAHSVSRGNAAQLVRNLRKGKKVDPMRVDVDVCAAALLHHLCRCAPILPSGCYRRLVDVISFKSTPVEGAGGSDGPADPGLDGQSSTGFAQVFQEVLASLNPSFVTQLHEILHLLHELCSSVGQMQMTIHKVARSFGPLLLRETDDAISMRSLAKSAKQRDPNSDECPAALVVAKAIELAYQLFPSPLEEESTGSGKGSGISASSFSTLQRRRRRSITCVAASSTVPAVNLDALLVQSATAVDSTRLLTAGSVLPTTVSSSTSAFASSSASVSASAGPLSFRYSERSALSESAGSLLCEDQEHGLLGVPRKPQRPDADRYKFKLHVTAGIHVYQCSVRAESVEDLIVELCRITSLPLPQEAQPHDPDAPVSYYSRRSRNPRVAVAYRVLLHSRSSETVAGCESLTEIENIRQLPRVASIRLERR